AHDRDRPTEAQHVLHGLARGDAVEHGDDALREVADAGVRGLRRERAELPVREDQEAVLVRGEHQADVLVLTGVTAGSRRSAPRRRSVVRSTAGSSDPTSPYQAPCTTGRTSSVDTSVPKKGTTATSPVKIPNASQKGTSSAHSPSAVSAARIIMARSWPTTQARKVAPASSSTRAPSGRYFGGSSDKTPSR